MVQEAVAAPPLSIQDTLSSYQTGGLAVQENTKIHNTKIKDSSASSSGSDSDRGVNVDFASVALFTTVVGVITLLLCFLWKVFKM